MNCVRCLSHSLRYISLIVRCRHAFILIVVSSAQSALYLSNGMLDTEKVALSRAGILRFMRSAMAFSSRLCAVVGSSNTPLCAVSFVMNFFKNSLAF